jgi:hypothetical protein
MVARLPVSSYGYGVWRGLLITTAMATGVVGVVWVMNVLAAPDAQSLARRFRWGSDEETQIWPI